MNRRNLLQGIALMFAAEAAEQVIPFGRVWSFPSKIIIPKELPVGTLTYDALQHFFHETERQMVLYGGARGGGGRLAAQMRAFHHGRFYTYGDLMNLAQTPESIRPVTV